MLLSREQVRNLLLKRNVCADEACSKCGKVLGELRFTSSSRPGEWCSRECRDGANALTPGKCRGCGTPLIGLRRGTIWCSNTCRMRHQHKPSQTYSNAGSNTLQTALAISPNSTDLPRNST